MLTFCAFNIVLIIVSVSAESEETVACKCTIFRHNNINSPLIVETIPGEDCDDDGDQTCKENCITMSKTTHFTVILMNKLCKVYINANDLQMGLASQTCNNRPLTDSGLRQRLSCRNSYYVSTTMPMNLIEKYNVFTENPNFDII